MLHGWLDTGAGFQWLAEGLQDKYYLIAPDLRGFGTSGHVANPLGYFFMEYVADLHALADHFCREGSFILLGHSLGGAVASIYAGSFPHRVSHFINLEGFGFPRHDFESSPHRVEKWLTGLQEKPFPVHSSFQSFANRLQERNKRLTPERALFLAKHLGEEVEGGVRMAADPKHMWPEPYPFPVEAFYFFWKNISAPSLLVMGEESEWIKYFPPGTYEKELARRQQHFPSGSKLVSLPDCGHMLHQDQPEALTAEIRKFLP